MNEKEALVKNIVEGIHEKKGRNVVVADLTGTDNSVCDYFVICEGNSPTQVESISRSVSEYVRSKTQNKPIATSGVRNAEWVAMDYVDVMVHIFLPEAREFYDLEHLWEDATLNEIPDIN